MNAVIHAAGNRQDDVYQTLVEIKDNILDGTVTITYHKKCRDWDSSASNLKYVRNVPTTSTRATVETGGNIADITPKMEKVFFRFLLKRICCNPAFRPK